MENPYSLSSNSEKKPPRNDNDKDDKESLLSDPTKINTEKNVIRKIFERVFKGKSKT